MASERPPLLCPLPRRSVSHPYNYPYSPYGSYHHSHAHSSYQPPCSPIATVTRSRRTPSLSSGTNGARSAGAVAAAGEGGYRERRRSSVGAKVGSPVVVDYTAQDGPTDEVSVPASYQLSGLWLMLICAAPADRLSEFLSLFSPSSPILGTTHHASSPSPTASFHPSLQPLPPAATTAATQSALVGGTTSRNATPTPRSASSHRSDSSESKTGATTGGGGGGGGGPILVPISSVLPPLPRAFSASPTRTRRYHPTRPRSRLSGNVNPGAPNPMNGNGGVTTAGEEGQITSAQYAWLLGSPISRCRAPAPRAEVELTAAAVAAFAALNVDSPQTTDLYAEPEPAGSSSPYPTPTAPSGPGAEEVGTANRPSSGMGNAGAGTLRLASPALPLPAAQTAPAP